MARRKADDIRAMRLLIDQFGAEIALEHRPPLPRDKRERLAMQMAVEDAAITWHTEGNGSLRQCSLNNGGALEMCNTPHDPLLPDWASLNLPRESRVAVIGPCPTFEDGQHGEVGWSRAERALRRALIRAGLHQDQITWLHCVWCWPDGGVVPAESARGRSRGRTVRIPRPPTTGELAAWHPFLMSALDAADVEYVLLHGGHAVHAWRPDLGVERVLRPQMLWQDRWLVSAIKHGSTLTRDRDVDAQREWNQGIDRFVQRVLNGVVFEDFTKRCMYCPSMSGSNFYAWDGDGIGVCEKHMKDNFGKAQAALKKSRELINKHYQGGML